MINLTILIIAFIFQNPTSNITGLISGKIVDKDRIGIPYAHIGVPYSKVGTVADEQGEFQLNISLMTIKDSLFVSSVGYSTIKLSFKTIKAKRNHVLILEAKENFLDEVIVNAKKEKKTTFGRSRSYMLSGWVFSGIANGNEIGRIFNNTESIDIVNFRFHLKSSDFDSVLFRINFYEMIDQNLKPFNRTEIVYKSRKTEGWQNVDLSDQSLLTDKQFFVSLEILKGWISNIESKRGAIVYSGKGSRKEETLVRPHRFSEFEAIDLVLSMRLNAFLVDN